MKTINRFLVLDDDEGVMGSDDEVHMTVLDDDEAEVTDDLYGSQRILGTLLVQ